MYDSSVPLIPSKTDLAMVVPREALPVVDFEETLPPEEVAEEELLLPPVDLEVVFPPEEEDDVLLLEEDEVDFPEETEEEDADAMDFAEWDFTPEKS